jgi:predicted O-methyltransferase YrrM
MIGEARLRKWSHIEIGLNGPIGGSTSKYLNAWETAILIKLVDSVSPKVMIEFGCNEGITAKRLLEKVPTIGRYIGIDISFDQATSETPATAGWAVANDPRFFILLQDSRSLNDDDLEECDAVFVDGDHSEATVLHESRLARRLVRPGGIIVWHDFGNPAVEVTQTLVRLNNDFDWPIQHIDGSWLAFMRT